MAVTFPREARLYADASAWRNPPGRIWYTPFFAASLAQDFAVFVARISLAGLLLTGLPTPGHSQCLLANPSFELGPAPNGLAGWNQFGTVDVSDDAAHGGRAVRLLGRDDGTWGLSAVWQALDTAPGAVWTASVQVFHPSTQPLLGQARALLNVEWRDAAGILLSYESHVAADASTPTDAHQLFTQETQPAPPGTATTHFLLGVQQGPIDPQPAVVFDLATFAVEATPDPTLSQWLDFPGGRTFEFSGRSWRVKGPGIYGPGPNQFCDGPDCVWVDPLDRLHLTVSEENGVWRSSEVALEDPLGYGDYVFTTVGALDTTHPNVVFAMFLWQYGPCYDPANGWWNPYNEIDLEFSRWGDPAADVGQFVVQPYDTPGNQEIFDVSFSANERTSHAFRWLPDRVEFRSWRGGPADESPATTIHAWTYSGPHLPRPEQPRVHVNLWQFNTPPDVEQEVVLESFSFVPECVACPPFPTAAPDPVPITFVSQPRPNPFNPRTTIHFTLERAGAVEVTVFDPAGRKVRSLVQDTRDRGEHRTVWNGLDDAGRPVASGVYFYRLRIPGHAEARKLVLVR